MVREQDVSQYLKGKELAAKPGMAEKWAHLDELYSKKYWHQLTVQLLEFVKEPEFQNNKMLIELYEKFIHVFELRINALSYMELCVKIVAQYDNPTSAYVFLDNCEKRAKSDSVAHALCKITRGEIKLEQENDTTGLKTLLDEIDELLMKTDGISVVHGRFYRLQSKYFLKIGSLTEYYRSALKFLGCSPQLSHDEEVGHAKNLAISALVADGMYNFAELLAHPVLNSLKRTQDEWLVLLMETMNSGNVDEFETLKKKWGSNKVLANNEAKLRTKVILLAIMEISFRQPTHGRTLTFQDIAKATNLRIDQVELYVMSAMAKELVKGQIDEVSKTVTITWVQPRIIMRDQIKPLLADRITQWQQALDSAQDLMKKENVEEMLEA